MVEAKYASPRISTMTYEQVLRGSAELSMKIYVITGWSVPKGELLKTLLDQMSLKFMESYGDMNFKEIEYAFRKEGTTIIDYAKDMNLNLLDQVLIPYLNKRLEVSDTEEQRKRTTPEQVVYTDEQIDNQRRGEFEAAFQAMKKGYHPLIFPYYGELLTKDGLIKKPEDLTDFIVESLGSGKENIYVKGE